MVRFDNVSKAYPLYSSPHDRLIEALPFITSRATPFWALRNVSFEVERGETFCLIGANGSGKSTLLQIGAGILQPTAGEVSRPARTAALLELGAGFNPEFTGRENVFLNAEIHGLSDAEIKRSIPSIEQFADIGPFIDRPVKEYSSGMYVRLAFSAAIHVEPELLIVDEALAVGDIRFAQRCIQRFEELKSRGCTILFVSHDLGLVKRLADRVAVLSKGELDFLGTPSDAVNRYVASVIGRDQQGDDDSRRIVRHGDGTSVIESVRLTDGRGCERTSFDSGQTVTAEVRARFDHASDQPMVGILIRDRFGTDVYGVNTRLAGLNLGRFEPGDQLCVRFQFSCRLTRQEYTLTVATQHADGTSQDWRDDILRFGVMDSRDLAGLADLEAKIEWSKE